MFHSSEQSLAFLPLAFTHIHTHGKDRKAEDEVKRYTDSSDSGWIVDTNSLYLYKKTKKKKANISKAKIHKCKIGQSMWRESRVKILKRLR